MISSSKSRDSLHLEIAWTIAFSSGSLGGCGSFLNSSDSFLDGYHLLFQGCKGLLVEVELLLKLDDIPLLPCKLCFELDRFLLGSYEFHIQPNLLLQPLHLSLHGHPEQLLCDFSLDLSSLGPLL